MYTDLLVLDAALTCDDPSLYVRRFNEGEFVVGRPWTLSGGVGKVAFQRGELVLECEDKCVVNAWHFPRFNTIKARIKHACNSLIREFADVH